MDKSNSETIFSLCEDIEGRLKTIKQNCSNDNDKLAYDRLKQTAKEITDRIFKVNDYADRQLIEIKKNNRPPYTVEVRFGVSKNMASQTTSTFEIPCFNEVEARIAQMVCYGACSQIVSPDDTENDVLRRIELATSAYYSDKPLYYEDLEEGTIAEIKLVKRD